MLLDILKAFAVIAIYMAVVAGGIVLARWMDRRRRNVQGDRK